MTDPLVFLCGLFSPLLLTSFYSYFSFSLIYEVCQYRQTYVIHGWISKKNGKTKTEVVAEGDKDRKEKPDVFIRVEVILSYLYTSLFSI